MRWRGHGCSYLLHIIWISPGLVYYQKNMRFRRVFFSDTLQNSEDICIGVGLHFFTDDRHLGKNNSDAF